MKHNPNPTRRTVAVDTLLWQFELNTSGETPVWQGETTALWTRKRNGVLTVYLGQIRGYQLQEAENVTQWMGRYTAPMERRLTSSYNGTRMWHRGAGIEREERLLRQAWHGELPVGFIGWWTPEHTEPAGGYSHIPTAADPRVAECGGLLLVGGAADGPERTCPVCAAKKEALATV